MKNSQFTKAPFDKLRVTCHGELVEPLNGRIINRALLFVLFIVHCSLCIVFAQRPAVTAKLDTVKIRIGEQAHLQLSIIAEKDVKVFPVSIPDTFHKLEVIKRSPIDTAKSSDGKTLTYHQTVTFTGFDSGFYVIEPLPVFFQIPGKTTKDSITTEAMLMQVQSVPVDTTKAIKDIKPPVEVPFTFKDALPYILGVILIALMIFVGMQLYKKWKRKPQTSNFKLQTPSRPPHEIALQSLKKIEEEKLWQAGYYKQYHSAVADTVRLYIEQRYDILSLEMPSDDTLKQIKSHQLPEEAYNKLSYLLHLADLVKFAKAIPIGTENETSMHHAVDFVMLTKPAIIEIKN